MVKGSKHSKISKQKIVLAMSKSQYHKYSLNEKFFDKWSPDMTWLLGFTVTDGNLVSHQGKSVNRYVISWTQKDKSLLEKIKQLLQSTHPVRCHISTVPGYKAATWYSLIIGNKNLYNSLLKLGITSKKSLTIKFPKIPKKYLSHFLRGCFDGDGGFNISRRGVATLTYTTASKKFAIGLDYILRTIVKLKKIDSLYKKRQYVSSYYQFEFSKGGDLVKFYRFIYNNLKNSICLLRKKIKLENFLLAKKLILSKI